MKNLERSEGFKKVFVNKDQTTVEPIFEKQLRTKQDSLYSQVEDMLSVKSIDRN